MFGTGTRFGNMTAQMKNTLDQAGGLWMSDGLVGKVGSVFTSRRPNMAARSRPSLTFHRSLHLGFVIVGLPIPSKARWGSAGHGKFALWCLDHRWRRGSRPSGRLKACAMGRHVADFAAGFAPDGRECWLNVCSATVFHHWRILQGSARRRP
jgi:NAD(P)H dehydrogenase (quinone)